MTGTEGNLEGGADKNRGVDCGRTGSYVAVPPVSVPVLYHVETPNGAIVWKPHNMCIHNLKIFYSK